MVTHVIDAIDAERRHDWEAAREHWHYAGREAIYGDFAALCNEREDRADLLRRRALGVAPTTETTR